ncbi:hypothetical protein [Pyrococcus abyssi]|nr:hypothetical protein [Pyrococcus abyssi]
MLDDVIKAIELERRKFEERANILEEVIDKSSSSISSKYEELLRKRRASFFVYSILMIGLLVVEIIVLLIIREKFNVGGIKISLILFFLLAILAFTLLGLIASRSESEDYSVEDKITLYRKLAKFYSKLKEALERKDYEKLRELADEVLSDPLLGKAIEIGNIGRPEAVAYALYLYLNRDKVEKFEVEEAINLVEGPMKLLLKVALGEEDEDRGNLKGRNE